MIPIFFITKLIPISFSCTTNSGQIKSLDFVTWDGHDRVRTNLKGFQPGFQNLTPYSPSKAMSDSSPVEEQQTTPEKVEKKRLGGL